MRWFLSMCQRDFAFVWLFAPFSLCYTRTQRLMERDAVPNEPWCMQWVRSSVRQFRTTGYNIKGVQSLPKCMEYISLARQAKLGVQWASGDIHRHSRNRTYEAQPPKEGWGGWTFQTQIQSVLSLKATKLLNSDHCPAMARRSVLRESTTQWSPAHRLDLVLGTVALVQTNKSKNRATQTTRKRQEIK